MPDYICKHCNKAFGSARQLRSHKVVHSDAKPFVCTICEKTFKTKGSLNQHMKLHTDAVNFSCDQCDKQFKTKGGLFRHKLIHEGVRAYKCNQCGKAFTQPSHLSNHMVIHSDGSKPFSCTVCNKEFARKVSVITHAAREHPHITDSSSCVRKTTTKTTTKTTIEPLDNGEVAVCTSQTTEISRDFFTTVSHIATETASVKVVSQRLPGVTIDTVTQGDSDPLITHVDQVLSSSNDYGFWQQLAELKNTTATMPTTYGDMGFDPTDKFEDIPI